jgi:hypothetical protein
LSAIFAGDAGNAKAFVVRMSKTEEDTLLDFQGRATF